MHKNAFISLIVLFGILIILTPAHAVYPGDPGFLGCVVVTEQGGLDDKDCDKVPTPFDNCPFVPNAEQADRDHNGIGDACDLVIDELKIEPDQIIQGRSVIINPALFNARQYPMRNLVVKAEVPQLGIATSQEMSIINSGERKIAELVFRVPDCAPPRFYDVVITVEYPYAPSQKEVFYRTVKVPVVPSGLCEQAYEDLTIVNILEVQDVDPVQGATYPFTIHNRQSESKAYVLSVDNYEEWGTVQIEPGSVIVIPAGESRDGAINVWSREGVSGKRSFIFTVQAKDDMKQIQLLADIPEVSQGRKQTPAEKLLLGIVAFLIVLLLLLGLFHAYRKKRK